MLLECFIMSIEDRVQSIGEMSKFVRVDGYFQKRRHRFCFHLELEND